MIAETDAHGNQVERGFEGGERYKYDFRICTSAKGWTQYDTTQDASYFGVWVHAETRRVFTFCEGDTTLVTCPTVEHFRAELQRMADFYGDPPPAFTCISSEGGVTHVFDEAARPAV